MTGIDFILDLAIVAIFAGVAGLVCRALRLSVVVGYLVAGMIIGPSTPPFLLVHDTDRIQMLADLGLVFLIFGIGLGFSLRRMQALGLSVPLATACGAPLILLSCRSLAFVMGFSDLQGLFFAGILMVSSSAIIAKVLEEIRSNHTRWGQLSLGVTLMEDIVAIIMLTLLTSMVVMSGGEVEEGDRSMWMMLTSFTGFVALFSVVVILLIPRLLRWLDVRAISELRMLVVAGLLLMLGWFSVWLGYSMALTAFILGAIIGSTPQRSEVDRLFEGLRHLFGAVFFVAMGMMFNIALLPEFWSMMVALVFAAVVLRAVALMVALIVTGNQTRDSIRAGLTLTPMGEFSFVIAFLGVSSGVMPETFYPAAVGASLATCLICPVLIRRSEGLSTSIEGLFPPALSRGIGVYRAWLDSLHAQRSGSMAWRLIAPRLVQTGVLLLLVAGLLALVPPGYGFVKGIVGADFLVSGGTLLLLLAVTGALLLPPFVAIWRNVSALSMIIAEAGTQQGRAPIPQVLIERAITSACLAFAGVWIFALIPTGTIPFPLLAAVLTILLLVTALLWKKLILWQSRMEVTFRKELTAARDLRSDDHQRWDMGQFEKGKTWELRVEEFTLPADSLHSGKSIMELNLRAAHSCSIVGIDRQGYAINSPSARERLFPGDKLLLLGNEKALEEATKFLAQRTTKPAWMDRFDNLTTERVVIPNSSTCHGMKLRDMDLVSKFGVQVAGIQRVGQEITTPGPEDLLLDGDEVLLVGTHDRIRAFGDSLKGSDG